MTELSENRCEACRVGAPLATEEEIAEFMPQIPEWSIVEKAGIRRLRREYEFSNFQSALDFANRVGAIAEEEGHHPEISIEWGRTAVQWWTHKIKGLHVNDFIMAAKTDRLCEE